MTLTGKHLLMTAAGAGIIALLLANGGRSTKQVASSGSLPHEQLVIPPAPALSEQFWREETLPNGTRCRLNLSPAVFKLDIEPWTEAQADVAERLWPDYHSAKRAVKKDWGQWLESVDWALGCAKVEEDEVLAEIELLILQWQREFIRRLIVALESRVTDSSAAQTDAVAWAHAARMALEPGFKPSSESVQRVFKSFSSQREFWTPLGFYGSTPELAVAWRAQRFFSAPLCSLFPNRNDDDLWNTWALLHETTLRDSSLKDNAARLWRLSGWLEESVKSHASEGMFGQISRSLEKADDRNNAIRHLKSTLSDNFPAGVAFMPRTSARETLSIALAIQKGRGAMDGVMNALSSTPQLASLQESSGWYARQRHSLLPLLRPQDSLEIYKLALTDRYRDRLRKAFAASLTKVRETHVSRSWFSWGTLSAAKPTIVVIKPALEVEPLATAYLRRAEACHWLRNRVMTEFGQTPSLENRLSLLATRIESLENRLLGLHAISVRDLGLANQPPLPAWAATNLMRAESEARAWLDGWESGKTGKEDTRYAVPVRDDDGTLTYWSTVGISLLKLEVRYEAPPALEIQDDNGQWNRVEWVGGTEARTGKLWIILKPETFIIPDDVFAEFERRGDPLTREEFRKLLSGCSTVAKAREKLAAR
jgi:hypothetical protein